MGVYYSKGAGMSLAEIEKEIRDAQWLLENKSYIKGYNKLERLCEFINDMIDQDCDIYRR